MSGEEQLPPDDAPRDSQGAAMSDVTMRQPCKYGCKTVLGFATKKGPVYTIQCNDCLRYQYNASYAEMGVSGYSLSENGIPPGLRDRVFTRDNRTCRSCFVKADDDHPIEVDHRIPRALQRKYGLDGPGLMSDAAFQTLCKRCNIGKGARADWTLEQCLDELDSIYRDSRRPAA